MQNNLSIDKAAVGAHGAIDRAAKAAVNAADEAARMVKPAIDRTSQVAHQAVEKAAGVAVPTLDWLSVNADRFTAARGKAVASGRQAVIDNPWQAMGAALALGLLVGRLLR
ncbi:MAG TPA: hypothetical protein VGO84_18065 [Burkholderiales bacterium]|jgi:ElaB/YqjD/DUF883 family membrane-anchored ribosome-binding protein|nr:hypothetical protein [Burkholderiales bacterium]